MDKKLKAQFDKMTVELLQHKYRYYVLDNASIDDYQYDMLEKKWMKLGAELGLDMDFYPNWVGFDRNHPLAAKALKAFKDK